jgi:hypothetical protein
VTLIGPKVTFLPFGGDVIRSKGDVAIGRGDVGRKQGDDGSHRDRYWIGIFHRVGSMKVTFGVTGIWIMALRRDIA